MRNYDIRRQRYGRQLMIPQFGEEGQRKMEQASVIIAGVGGLGSISAYYLVAAGIGRLRIVDRDVVDLSNLNRQIIHTTEDLGRPKVISAAEKLNKLNPAVRVESIQAEINEESVLDLANNCSLILDATDNFITRSILNKASIDMQIPFVMGGIEAFSGMVTAFSPGKSGCLDCMLPAKNIESPSEGIIGPLPGIVASIQALEAIKILCGMPDTLMGRLLLIDGFSCTFKEIMVDRNPNCKTCRHST